MAHFYDPDKKGTAPLSSLKLPLDKSFTIGLSGSGPSAAKLNVRFAADVGDIDELKAPGPGLRKFKVTPRVPGAHTLLAMYSGMAEVLLPVEVVQPRKADEDMVYTGAKLYWFQNLPPGAKGPIEFSATSGLPDSQLAVLQQKKDAGPIPEGRYTFLARRDPKREATVVDAKSGQLDTREGIQILPHGSHGWQFPGWGSHRVRLTPKGSNAAPHRGGFYLHDSHKGYSHGCIEIAGFFKSLIEYAEAGKSPKHLTLRVVYGDDTLSTYGNTLQPTAPGEYDAPAAD